MKMKIYRLIDDLLFEECCGDGFYTGGEKIAPKGSIWTLDEESKLQVIGDGYRLDSVEEIPEFLWIEVDEEDFKKYFEEV